MRTDFMVNLAAGFTQALVLVVLRWAWSSPINAHPRNAWLRRFLSHRRNYFYSAMTTIVCVGGGLLIWPTSRPYALWFIVFFLLVVVFQTLAELENFWHTGIIRVQRRIPEDTYPVVFSETTNSLRLLGSVANRYCASQEFQAAVGRVHEHNGEVQLLLAHPDSPGLAQASARRDPTSTKYPGAAWTAFRTLFEFQERHQLKLDVRIYHAESIDHLPKFRSIFTDSDFCTASIAVYGREDYGLGLPQLIVNGGDSDKRAMFDALLSYYKSFLEDSVAVDDDFRNTAKSLG